MYTLFHLVERNGAVQYGCGVLQCICDTQGADLKFAHAQVSVLFMVMR